MAHRLDLPQSPVDKVYRAMEAVVRGNAIFQRVVKPGSFRTWSGKPDDGKAFTYEIAPAMRWTPTRGPEEWKTPHSQMGDLLVNCEILLPGTNISDLLNFWYMVQCSFMPPGNATMQVQQLLIGAGARSGLVTFSQPAFDPDPDGQWLAGSAQIRVQIEITYS